MRRREGESHLCKLGLQGRSPRLEGGLRVSAELSVVCHCLFWPLRLCAATVSECASFPQQQDRISHVPSPGEQPEE